MTVIPNAANRPLFSKSGTVPDVSGALKDWFQNMTFGIVTKSVVNFQNVETVDPINFQGVIQPYTGRQLSLLPEGQRAWNWLILHADPVLTLNVDSVVIYKGKQTRVMARKDYILYGYVEYHLVTDWTGSGPSP